MIVGELGEDMFQVIAGELPLEGLGNGFVMGLKSKQSLFQFRQAVAFVWSENLALDDREIDFYLVEPTGVNWGVDQESVGIPLGEAANGLGAAMGGAVVGHPKDPLGRAIWFPGHDQVHQTVEGFNSGLGFTAAEELGAMDIPGRHIGERTGALILKLDAADLRGCGSASGMDAGAGLDAGLFIGADDVVPRSERLAFPPPLIEIEDAAGFGGEVRVAGENPASVRPGLDGVGAEPTPDRGAADRSDHAGAHGLAGDVGVTQARQRQPALGRELAGQGFDLNHDLWGKNAGDGPAGTRPPDLGGDDGRSVGAIC